MKQWHMIFDVDRCTNCRNCFLSVLDEYDGNDYPGYTRPIKRIGEHLLEVETHEQGSGTDLQVAYLPVTCNNCANAPCVKASKDGSVYRRSDGIVMIDPDKSKGKQEIVRTCPYGHIHWNEEQNVPQLWIFDAHLLDQGWKQPRMVDACPTGAIEAVKCPPKDMDRRVEVEGLRTLHPEYKTDARIFYKNLDRVTSGFLVGSVIEQKAGKTDALEGADVILEHAGVELKRTTTNYFGEFRFTGLPRKEMSYRVTVNINGRQSQSLDVSLRESGRITTFAYQD